jgi:hypothetical protein
MRNARRAIAVLAIACSVLFLLLACVVENAYVPPPAPPAPRPAEASAVLPAPAMPPSRQEDGSDGGESDEASFPHSLDATSP